MDIVKISMIGVCGVMLGFILKGTRPEYASFISMAVGLLILGLAVGKVSYLFETLERLRQSLPVDGSYITSLVIDLFCKLSVMVLSMPVLLAILDTISEFLV